MGKANSVSRHVDSFIIGITPEVSTFAPAFGETLNRIVKQIVVMAGNPGARSIAISSYLRLGIDFGKSNGETIAGVSKSNKRKNTK
jgi:hypothetical protein